MARLLPLFSTQHSKNECLKYNTPALMYEGLKNEDAAAIRCLSNRISGQIILIGNAHKLKTEDIEELICDSITLLIQKIRSGQYVFQGYEPSTFAIEIAKNRANNYRRMQEKNATVVLEPYHDSIDEPDSDFMDDWKMLEVLLSRLNEKCNNLIRLKYIDQKKDKDVIELQLTSYTTVDALKNHRAQCMKKLIELGAQAFHHKTA